MLNDLIYWWFHKATIWQVLLIFGLIPPITISLTLSAMTLAYYTACWTRSRTAKYKQCKFWLMSDFTNTTLPDEKIEAFKRVVKYYDVHTLRMALFVLEREFVDWPLYPVYLEILMCECVRREFKC